MEEGEGKMFLRLKRRREEEPLDILVLENAKKSKNGVTENVVFSRSKNETSTPLCPLSTNQFANVKIVSKELISDKLCLNAVRSAEADCDPSEYVVDEYTVVPLESSVPVDMLPKIFWSSDCDNGVFLADNTDSDGSDILMDDKDSNAEDYFANDYPDEDDYSQRGFSDEGSYDSFEYSSYNRKAKWQMSDDASFEDYE